MGRHFQTRTVRPAMTLRSLLPCVAALALAVLPGEEPILVKAGVRMDRSGTDDLARLQRLAGGVGWEFEPDAATAAALKRIGMRSIRCINVDPLEGSFTATGAFTIADPGQASSVRRLLAHFDTCRRIGANPHIIIGTGLPRELRRPSGGTATEAGIMGQAGHAGLFGPTDPERYIAYCQAYMAWVMVDQGFRDARFEFGNEPDIGGQFPFPQPPLPAKGSRALFDGYLAAYRLAAAAADRVEAAHPGLRVRLGGPALAWAYTFRFGECNWSLRFIEECAAQRLRLDFIGLHFYGNISPIDGPADAPGPYPPFTRMLAAVAASRDRLLPSVPIWITEWGPSYHTGSDPGAAANANAMGGAWCLAFLDRLVQSPVEGALFLVTTDGRRKRDDGGWDECWGWPALFTNPTVTGGALPKAPFHAFDMVARLRGVRVATSPTAAGIGCFAAAEAGQRRLRVLAWNFAADLRESGAPVEQAVARSVPLAIVDAAAFFGVPRVGMSAWMVSAAKGDIHAAMRRREPLTAEAATMPATAAAELAVAGGRVETVLDLPPSSFALLEFAAAAPR